MTSSAFSKDIAIRLADVAATKRVPSPFATKPEELLAILRKAEWEYNRHQDDAEFEARFFAEGKELEALEHHFQRFHYYWERTHPCARDEIGYFADQEKQGLGEIFERNASMCETLALIKTGIRAAIEYRYENSDGRPEKRPGLKEFVATIRQGWADNAPPGVAFGDTFQGGIEGDDREPVSAAAKLVVAAAKILDPEVNARDCETAMRAIKGG